MVCLQVMKANDRKPQNENNLRTNQELEIRKMNKVAGEIIKLSVSRYVLLIRFLESTEIQCG